MQFLIDAQLPPSLARALKAAGYDTIHLFEVGLLSARDSDIWTHARRTKLIILTKDQDFAARRQNAKSGPIIVWLRMGNIANNVLAKRLLAALPQVISAIEKGETLIEVR